MTKEQVQDFTRKVANANRSGLVLIKFEILFAYFDDIEAAFGKDKEALKQAVRNADAVLKSFQSTLDFEYDLSARLFALYDFHRRQLAKVLMRNSLEDLSQSRAMLQSLFDAFKEAAKQDTSAPLMQNAQQVYAGYTYGKHDINESCNIDSSRGFFA